MKFFEYMLKNTLLIHYITLVIVVVGILSIGNMQREARPNVNFNRVNIFAVYPGASPSDVEELIIDPIEDKISEVDGIEEYRSVSFQGAGSISVKIDDEYPDVDSVIDDIRRKVSEVRDLPSEVENPVVSEVKAINIPILGMALYGDLSPLKMKMEVEKLKDFLKNAGQYSRGDLISKIRSYGFDEVGEFNGIHKFQRGKWNIRLDPPQAQTNFHHMHVLYGKDKTGQYFNNFLNRVSRTSPAAHIRIKPN